MAAESSFELRLTRIELLAANLVDEHNRLKEMLNAVIEERDYLLQLLADKEEEIKNFQNQQKITKIVTSISEDTFSHTDLKLMINEYIREIDKCIAHLSE